MKNLKINLSLSGGGVKGIAHLGGIRALEENYIEIQGIAGTSAGAIIASLYGAGYSLESLQEIMYEQDLSHFKDRFSVLRVAKGFGLYRGDAFLEWMEKMLLAQGVIYFRDYEKIVKIVASEVNQKRIKVFSTEDTPNVKVAEAVRMSMSIPIFYVPYSYLANIYVDGAVMNNLPLKVFDNSKYPTLGFTLVQSAWAKREEICDFVSYLSALVEMVIMINEQRQIELSDSHIINIDTGDIKAIDFSLNNKEKRWLYDSGYRSVKDNLKVFLDRRHRRGLLSLESINEIAPTTVELEEYAGEMVNFIKERVDVEKVDSILSIKDDDYLFSYIIAKMLNKKFSVFDRIEDKIEYNNINCDENVIMISFKYNGNNLKDIVKKIDKRQIKYIFSYTANTKEDQIILYNEMIPQYICYRIGS